MTRPTRPLPLLAAAAATALLAACAGGGPMIGVGVSGGGGGGSIGVGGSFPLGGLGRADSGATFSQASLPAPVQVPAGHAVVLETVGTGTVVYECRDPVGGSGAPAWVFVGPQATLADRRGRTVGRYFGPPATWVANDGSAITGTQLAVAPAATGHLPLQLVRAEPAAGTPAGTMSGVSHVQRVATQGGVAPSRACDAASRGQRETVPYRADYIFWKAG